MARNHRLAAVLRGHAETVRLATSLAVSLAAHAIILGLTPGHPTWLGETHAIVAPRPPITVTLVRRDLPPAETIRPAVKPSPETGALPAPDREEQPVGSEPEATRARTDSTDAPAQPAMPSGLIPGPWYYPARYLHRRPSPLKPIWPDYPREFETVRGRVVILLLINEEGMVDHHRIEGSDPAGVFEDAVIKAFTGAAYAPGLITGQKVKSQLLAEVFFEPGMPPRAAFSIMENAIPVQGPASSLGSGN